jgi:hypothetical protein
MTILGTALQIGVSVLLSIPSARLIKDEAKITPYAVFLAIFVSSYVGGLVASIPVAIIITLLILWIGYLNLSGKTKKLLFQITFAAAAIYLALRIVQLPIKIYLEQSSFMIASNVAGIFIGLAIFIACLERYRFMKDIKTPAVQKNDS